MGRCYDREKTIGIEYDPDTKTWRRLELAKIELEEWVARRRSLDNPDDDPTSYTHNDVDDLTRWEQSFGPIIDRLLLAKGISKVDQPSRKILVTAFYKAISSAAESRKRNAEGDYSPDKKAKRFPEWRPAENLSYSLKVSLNGIVKAWWGEAKVTGRKPSTYESDKNTVAAFVAFLGHDDAARVTTADVVRFGNPQTPLARSRTLPASATNAHCFDHRISVISWRGE